MPWTICEFYFRGYDVLQTNSSTKVSIKWSKTGKKAEEEVSDDETSASDSDVDMMTEEEPEAPDLYRNSALGMLNLREDDWDEDDDDEDEEDEMLEAFEDEMMDDDEGSETESDNEEGSDMVMDDMEGDELDEEDSQVWEDVEEEDEEGGDENAQPFIIQPEEGEAEWEDEEEDENSDSIVTDEEEVFGGLDGQGEFGSTPLSTSTDDRRRVR